MNYRTSVLLTATTMLFIPAANFAQSPQEKPATIPAGAKIELLSDRNEFFLGENILVFYRITNAGSAAFPIDVGGDYRGGNRASRFKVTAVDAADQALEDPFPNQADMGGLSPIANLEPGGVWYENVPLNRYRKLDQAGEYQIEVAHDLGWGDRGENDLRAKTIRLTLKEPSEADAQKVFDAMLKMRTHSGNTWGKKGRAAADFTLLTHPVYLPILAQQADPDAVRAISHMATIDSTRALLRLADIDDDATAAMAGLALSARISPAFAGIGSPWWPQGKPPAHTKAWSPDLAAPAIARAHTLLNRGSDQSIMSAAAILMQLGDANDLSALIVAVELVARRAATAAITNKDHHEGPRWTLRETVKAFEQFASRGLTLQTEAKSDADFLAFIAMVATSPNSRPPGYETTFAAALGHANPIVRETSVRRLPDPLPASLLSPTLELMADSDPKVRSAACEIVNNLKLPGGRKLALQAIAKSDENWTVWMAVDVALRDGGRVPCAKLLADRFAELSDHQHYVSMHIMGQLCRITIGGNMSGSWHFLKESGGKQRARALRDAWKKMIDEHEEDLRAGKLISFSKETLPADLLPPGVNYSPPR
jgi:hypothetical protein